MRFFLLEFVGNQTASEGSVIKFFSTGACILKANYKGLEDIVCNYFANVRFRINNSVVK